MSKTDTAPTQASPPDDLVKRLQTGTDGLSGDDYWRELFESRKAAADAIQSLEAKVGELEVAANEYNAAAGYEHERAGEEHATVNRVWKALGISTYEQAGGKEISEIVADWKARAEAAEAALATERTRALELIDAVEFLRDKWGDPNGTEEQEGAWDQSERILVKVRALAKEPGNGN